MQSDAKPTNDKNAALDALDQQLLGLLRMNARTPTATLARKLGVSGARSRTGWPGWKPMA